MSSEKQGLGAYLRAIEIRHGYVRPMDAAQLEGKGGIRIARAYVESKLSTRRIAPEEPIDTWPELLRLIDALRQNPVLAILGDPGSGKSTIVSWISRLLADPAPNLYKTHLGDLVPIPMILREMDLSKLDGWESLLDAFLKTDVGKAAGDGMALRQAFADGKAFVLVDGFDEVSSIDVRSRVSEALCEGQSRSWRTGVRWLATSRIVGYEDSPFLAALRRPMPKAPAAVTLLGQAELFETDDSFGPSDVRSLVTPKHADAAAPRLVIRAGVTGKSVRRYRVAYAPVESGLITLVENENELIAADNAPQLYVAPFDDPSVKGFVSRWYSAREPSKSKAQADAKEFSEALHARDDLTTLGRTPQILAMMCLVHRVYTELPNGRSRLFDRVAEAYLHTFPRRRNSSYAYPLEEKRRWLARVGFEMQRKRSAASVEGRTDDDGLLISQDELESCIALEMGGGQHATEAQAFIDFLKLQSGLLMPRGEGQYAFWHLSFQEYFAAEHLRLAAVWRPKNDFWNVPSTAINGTQATHEPSDLHGWMGESVWSETFRLLFQSLDADGAAWLLGDLCGAWEGTLDWQPAKDRFIPSDARHCSGHLLSAVAVDRFVALPSSVRIQACERLLRKEREYQELLAEHHISDSSLTAFGPLLAELLVARPNPSEDDVRNEWRVIECCYPALADPSPISSLASLQSLDLSGTQVTDAGLEHLKSLTSLQSLYLSNTQVTDAGLEHLKSLTSLQSLYLYNTQVTDVGLEHLKSLKSLQRLSLSGRQVTDAGLEHLKSLTSLLSLGLYNTQVTDAGLEHLKSLTSLQSLVLSSTQVTDAGLENLKALTSLQTLDLSNTQVTDAGLEHLKSLTSLQWLGLSGTQVTDAGLEHLKSLTSLQSLVLSSTQVADAGLEHLKSLTSLQSLNLSGTKVTDAGLEHLKSLTSLQTLYLMRTQVTDLTAVAHVPSVISDVRRPSPNRRKKTDRAS